MDAREQRELDGALRRVLRPEGPAPAACDAEMAVAYVEGRLRSRERHEFESHMVACPGCRAAAASMAQELLPPASERVVPRRRWNWTWAVPAMAGILVVGSVVYFERERVQEPKVEPVATVAKESATAPAVPVQPIAPSRDESVKEEQRSARANRFRGVRVTPAPASNETPRPSVEPRSDVAAQAVQAPPPPAAQATALPDQEFRQQQKQEPVAFGSTQATVSREKALERREADKARQAAPTRLLQTSVEGGKKTPAIAGALAPQVMALPDGAPLYAMAEHDGTLWAVSTLGRVFRSTDRGRTWTSLESPTTKDLTGIRWDPQTNSLVIVDKEGKEYRLGP